MKKGITLTVLTATVVIMFIIIGVTGAIGISSIKTASYEEFISKINRVSDSVNEYYIEKDELPITSEIVAKEGLPETLTQEITTKGDTNNNLFVVDMRKINVENVNIGSGSINDMNVFVVAENTNNVYYLKGIDYKGETYHGIALANRPYWVQNGLTITNGNYTLEAGDLFQYSAGVDDYTGAWKVLGAEDGNLLLMSTDDITSLKLYGLEGDGSTTNYGLLNGIDRLNELCVPYGIGTGAVGARSIKIEDVDKLTGYDKTTCGVNGLAQYGNRVSFSWNISDNGKVDYESTNGKKGTLSSIHSNGFSYIDFNTMTKITVAVNGEKMPTLTSNYYSYGVGSTPLPTTSQKATEMIFGKYDEELKNYGDCYWLSSLYVRTYPDNAGFGINIVKNGSVSSSTLFFSIGYQSGNMYSVRAVVKLSPNIRILTKDNTLGWSYTI